MSTFGLTQVVDNYTHLSIYQDIPLYYCLTCLFSPPVRPFTCIPFLCDIQLYKQKTKKQTTTTKKTFAISEHWRRTLHALAELKGEVLLF